LLLLLRVLLLLLRCWLYICWNVGCVTFDFTLLFCCVRCWLVVYCCCYIVDLRYRLRLLFVVVTRFVTLWLRLR
jgi:hypothetical protein